MRELLASLEPHDSDGEGGHWFWSGEYTIRLTVRSGAFLLDLIVPSNRDSEPDRHVKSVSGDANHPFYAIASRYDQDGDLDALRPAVIATLEEADGVQATATG